MMLRRILRVPPLLPLEFVVFAAAPGPQLSAGPLALYALLGVTLAIAFAAIGLGYWLWRRERGPLHRADEDVLAAAGDAPGESARQPIGGERPRQHDQRAQPRAAAPEGRPVTRPVGS
jgi:hypothetical protein